MNISVIGLGYLGLTHAAAMAELGHTVYGVDVDSRKIDFLDQGVIPFHEPGLNTLVDKHRDAGDLKFSTSSRDAAMNANCHFIAVGTPQADSDGGRADLRSLFSSVEALVKHLQAGHHYILIKSTVPVGTCAKLQNTCDHILAPVSNSVSVTVLSHPEFLREGRAITDSLSPDRIVVGSPSKTQYGDVAELMEGLYGSIIASGATPTLIMDRASSELVKVSANAFLATKISFINAVADVAQRAGADVTAIADAIGLDSRIGREFLDAGIGFGGGCLPKDIRAFGVRSEELGAADIGNLMAAVDAVNLNRRRRVLEVVEDAVGGTLSGSNLAILGCTFKPLSDDVRDSPALAIAMLLQLAGANTRVFDPMGLENGIRVFPTMTASKSVVAAAENADCLLVLTPWSEFLALHPQQLEGVVREKVIFDPNHAIDRETWADHGWRVVE